MLNSRFLSRIVRSVSVLLLLFSGIDTAIAQANYTTPVAYYPLNNFSNITLPNFIVADSSGNGFNSVATTNFISAIDKRGDARAAVFSNPGGQAAAYVDLGTPVRLLSLSTANFTVSSWVKVNATVSNQRIFSTATGTLPQSPGTVLGLSDNGKMLFRIGTGDVATSVTVKSIARIDDNQWHHLAAVVNYTSGRVRLYIDGVLQPLEKELLASGGTVVTGTPGIEELNISTEAVALQASAIGLRALIGNGTNSSTVANEALSVSTAIDEIRLHERAISVNDVRGLSVSLSHKVSGLELCRGNQGTLMATGLVAGLAPTSASWNYRWFATPVGGLPISLAANLSTGILEGPKLYYLQIDSLNGSTVAVSSQRIAVLADVKGPANSNRIKEFTGSFVSTVGHYYTFNGGDLRDQVTSSAAYLAVNPNGAPTGTDSCGTANLAISLNNAGNGQYIGLTGVTLNPSAFSLSFYFKATRLGIDQDIVTQKDAGAAFPRGFKIGLNAGNNLVVQYGNGVTSTQPAFSSSTSIGIDRWYKVVLTYTPGNLSLYINDGVDRITGAPSNVTNLTLAPNQPLVVGGDLQGGILSSQFSGFVDEVRIHRTELPPSLVTEFMNVNTCELKFVASINAPCYGSPMDFFLTNGEANVSYQLFDLNTNQVVGTALNGNPSGTIQLVSDIINSPPSRRFGIRATDPLTNCVRILTQTYAVASQSQIARPVIVARSATTICPGQSVDLVAPGGFANYHWYLNGGTAVIANTRTFTATASGSYTVMVENLSSCSSEVSAAVTVNVLTTPSAPSIVTNPNLSLVTLCSGDSVTLSIGPAFQGAGTTYRWSTGATTPSIVVKGSGNYSVSYTPTGQCASPFSVPTRVTVNMKPLDFNENKSYSDSIYLNREIYFPFSEDSVEVTVFDSSGNFRNSTSVNLVKRASKCGPVDSTTRYFNNTQQSRININYSRQDQRFSVSAKIYIEGAPTAPDQFTIVAKHSPSTVATQNRDWELLVNSELKAVFNIYNNSATPQQIVLPYDLFQEQWYEVTATFDGNTMKLYIDGVEEGSLSGVTMSTTAAGPFAGARRRAGGIFEGFFNGRLDDIQIWSRALTPANVRDVNVNKCSVNFAHNKFVCPNPTDSVKIFLTNTEPEVEYELFNKATNQRVGGPKTYTLLGGVGIEPEFLLRNIFDTTTYYIVATNKTTRCSRRMSYEPVIRPAIVPDQPIITSRFGHFNICEGGFNVLRVDRRFFKNIFNLTWNTLEIADSITVRAPGTYFVTARSPEGCNIVSVPVVVNLITAIVQPTIFSPAILPVTVCEGETVKLKASTTSPGIISWRWFLDDANDPRKMLADTIDSISVSKPGQYFARARNLYCLSQPSAAKIVQTIAKTARPTATPLRGLLACDNDSVQLQATDAQGGTYQWNNGETTRAIWVKVSGEYFVRITEPSKCQSDWSPTRRVTITPTPAQPSILNPPLDPICTGDSIILQAPVGFRKYRWSFQGVKQKDTSLSTFKITRIPSPNRPAFVWLRVTNNDSCWSEKSDSFQVNFTAAPARQKIRPGGVITLCEGSPDRSKIQLKVDSAISGGQNGDIVKFQWFRNGSSMPNEIYSSLTADTFGTYWVEMSVQSGTTLGCRRRSDTVQVITYPQADTTVTLLSDTSVCAGTPVLMQVRNEAGYSYQWLNQGSEIAGANFFALTVTQAGEYRCRITSNGCTVNSEQVTVKYNNLNIPVITADPVAPTAICELDSAKLKIDSVVNGKFKWFRNNIELKGDTLSSLWVYDPGVYKATISVGQCTQESDPVTVSLKPVPVAIASFSGQPEFCTGDSMVLFASTQDSMKHQWYRNGVLLPGEDTSFLVVKIPGIYHVLNTLLECQDSSNYINISEIARPRAAILPAQATKILCRGDFFFLQTATVDPRYRYTWLRNGSPIQNATGEQYQIMSEGTYSLRVSNGTCDTLSDTIRVSYSVPPRTNLGRDTIICGNLEYILRATAPNVVKYEWQDQSSADTFAVLDSGIYWVALTDTNGCVTRDTIVIGVTECDPVVYLPTAFTPNKDNINDQYQIQGYNIGKFELRVYNRWGQMVFFSNDITKSWNGQFDGADVPSGDYRYVCDFEGPVRGKTAVRQIVGTVTVIR